MLLVLPHFSEISDGMGMGMKRPEVSPGVDVKLGLIN